MDSQKWLSEALSKIYSMSTDELFGALSKSGLIEGCIPLFKNKEEAIQASFPEYSLVSIGYPLQNLVYRVGKENTLHFVYHVNE